MATREMVHLLQTGFQVERDLYKTSPDKQTRLDWRVETKTSIVSSTAYVSFQINNNPCSCFSI